MSVNIEFSLRVSNIVDEAQAQAVLGELRELLRDEGIADQVRVATEGEGGVWLVVGETDFPLIVSRSYLWCPKFESSVDWYVKEVAPSATVALEWNYPDEAY
ncbi:MULTISPECIES: hypothetical protein [unclassified Streptomyces]|uniref:hypothetical protein n=1 Tax=unclassified Streptomyces TaxID=2593676 RepID=UPI00365E8DE7